MDIAHWIALAVVICLWIGKRRERIKRYQDAAAHRARHTVDRTNYQSVGRL